MAIIRLKLEWLDTISRPIRFLYLGLANAKVWLEEYKNDHDETLLQVLDSGFGEEAGTLGPAFTWNLTAGEIFLELRGFKIAKLSKQFFERLMFLGCNPHIEEIIRRRLCNPDRMKWPFKIVLINIWPNRAHAHKLSARIFMSGVSYWILYAEVLQRIDQIVKNLASGPIICRFICKRQSFSKRWIFAK